MKHKKLNKNVDSQNHQYLCNVNQESLTQVLFSDFVDEYKNSVDALDTLQFAKDVHSVFGFCDFDVWRDSQCFHFHFDDNHKAITVWSIDMSLEDFNSMISCISISFIL